MDLLHQDSNLSLTFVEDGSFEKPLLVAFHHNLHSQKFRKNFLTFLFEFDNQPIFLSKNSYHPPTGVQIEHFLFLEDISSTKILFWSMNPIRDGPNIRKSAIYFECAQYSNV